ncbi:hypothetical protein [Thalassospira alkalitolerans]|uniref:hypothetical protein n=1 Tax=Thalassospira alkalitolerans TaxID=1293890 RepID=UPI003AA9A59A
MAGLATYLFFLGTALLPVYIFNSGGIQPAHLVLFTFSMITLLTRGFPVTLWSMALLAIFVHAFSVESTYVFLGGDPQFLLNGVFLFFNIIIAAAAYVHVRETGLKTLLLGVACAATIAIGTVAYSGVNLSSLDGGGRPTGTFNNPNQLGYFSACLLSITFLLYKGKQLNYWMAAIMFAIAMLLAIASLSKAAIISNFVVIILALRPVRSRNAMFGWAIIGLIGVFYLFQQFQNGAFDELLFVKRLANISIENDSSLRSRGYFAFVEGSALQLLFGMGAQNINKIVGHEVHSTFASILNNYGLIGLTIFSIAMLNWAVKLFKSYGFVGFICVAAPPMLYGITHNGTRFTFFWLLFAASMAYAERERRHSSPKATIESDGRY